MTHTLDFVAFWGAYPRRVGKLDAQKAYDKARRQASAAEILDGVGRYIAHKPAYADWAHPGTWLRAGRWLDEYDVTVPRAATVDWFEECRRIHGGECGLSQMRHHTRKQLDAGKRESV